MAHAIHLVSRLLGKLNIRLEAIASRLEASTRVSVRIILDILELVFLFA